MTKAIVFDAERMKYPNTGLYNYCLHLGRALLRQAHQEGLQFYVPPSAKTAFGNEADYLLQNPSHKLRLPSSINGKLWHATHQGTDYYPHRQSGPVMLTIHDLNFLYDEGKTEKRKQAYLASLQKKVERADALVCISEFTKSEVLQYLQTGDKPITVIHNGCSIEPITELRAPAFVPNQPFLFTIGMTVAKKNFAVLPPLLKGNNWLLLIAGNPADADYKQKVLDVAQAHGVAEQIRFIGPVSENEKQWYYQHCLAFVFPSISEGFGLPVVEAMHFGKPVFLSNRTSLPEIGGDLAYYFSSFEPEAMQDLLNKGLKHFEAAQPQAALKARAAMFDWDNAAKDYWQVYRSLL